MLPRIALPCVVALACAAAACSTPTKGPVISADEARIPPAPAPTSPPSDPKPASIAEAPTPAKTPPPAKTSKLLELEMTPQSDQAQQATTPPPAANVALGSPCSAGTQGCGKAGKVAVVTSFMRMRAHDAAQPCKTVQTTPQLTPQLASACIDGERVFVSSVCVMCRMDSETNMHGVVAEMTVEQLEAAQKLAALPPKPALSTTAAWKGAIEAAAARAKK